jgi:hypothetical protein
MTPPCQPPVRQQPTYDGGDADRSDALLIRIDEQPVDGCGLDDQLRDLLAIHAPFHTALRVVTGSAAVAGAVLPTLAVFLGTDVARDHVDDVALVAPLPSVRDDVPPSRAPWPRPWPPAIAPLRRLRIDAPLDWSNVAVLLDHPTLRNSLDTIAVVAITGDVAASPPPLPCPGFNWKGRRGGRGYGKSYPVGRFHVHVMFRAFATYLPIVAWPCPRLRHVRLTTVGRAGALTLPTAVLRRAPALRWLDLRILDAPADLRAEAVLDPVADTWPAKLAQVLLVVAEGAQCTACDFLSPSTRPRFGNVQQFVRQGPVLPPPSRLPQTAVIVDARGCRVAPAAPWSLLEVVMPAVPRLQLEGEGRYGKSYPVGRFHVHVKHI